jgi:hypothetical protein
MILKLAVVPAIDAVKGISIFTDRGFLYAAAVLHNVKTLG